ncbi:uncharacterized protein A1O9_07828 [Exophiala aquamarina CBS 119918]|uniref:Uncharacterized protein n=1 Tax=Exophiala aquamarina CBS 119918 TaxID=1182545 RepID=A0A072P941_9EURO|nr:uncharacterized protein A1O9_07828 [Exophiala aquamarina CBS 119918]KEF56247.1 hypothetical protein A1O9_07828 [Exophiala aquamarina CBS 119918]
MPSSRHNHSPHDHRIPRRRSASHRQEARIERHAASEPQLGNHGSSLFVVDRQGDRRNLEYGAPDRYAVPRFRSAGKGSVLGLARNHRITDASETRRVVEDAENDSSRRYHKQSLLAFVPPEDDKPSTLPGVQDDWHDVQRDYIPFIDAHRRKRTRLSEAFEAASSEGEGSDASATEMSGKASHLEVFDAFKSDPIHQRQLQLSKATENNPGDVRAWLDLIRHQDATFKNQSNVPLPSSASSRSLADLKISLYREALQQVKDQEGKEALLIGLMHEGAKVWGVHKQMSEWDHVLQTCHSVELWTLYLNFKQTNVFDYSSQECLKVYQGFLQVLNALDPGRARDESCIYIILRLSLYLWQIDMTELAIGIWQALLELNFCSPRYQSPSQSLASFEEFWDSEGARIGEDKTSGWGSGLHAEVDRKIERNLKSNQNLDLDTWAQIETDLWHSSGLPARSLDDTNDEDPYRIVLFSDIQPYLLYPTTEEGTILLLDAFLLFSGLDPISTLSAAGRWQTDPFIYSHFPSSKSSRMSPVATSDTAMPPDSQSSTLELKMHKTEHTSLISPSNLPIAMYPDLIHRALSQLTHIGHEIIPRDIIMQYVISLEASIDLKAARKQAKSFLKRMPNSLRLYNSYALIEYQLGNFELAEKVWSTALSLQASLNARKDDFTFTAWRDWVWSYMSLRLFHKAGLLLALIADGQVHLSQLQIRESSLAVAARIKAERFLVKELESCLTDRHPRNLVPVIDLLAFHMYLNYDCQLDRALQIFSRYLLSIERLAAEWVPEILELVHERRAILVHAHATTFGRPFKPKQLFTALKESIHKFPGSCFLLGKHHIYNQQSGAVDRLRELDLKSHHHEQSNDRSLSVASICLEVSIELARPSYSGSTNHSVRMAFQRAVSERSSGIYCVTLWKSYILWELTIAQHSNDTLISMSRPVKQPARNVKDVFHAALKACPWSKEIYMLPFRESLLKSFFSKEELKQLYHSIVERGLRVRFDISDMVV